MLDRPIAQAAGNRLRPTKHAVLAIGLLFAAFVGSKGAHGPIRRRVIQIVCDSRHRRVDFLSPNGGEQTSSVTYTRQTARAQR
jgi:hypothetical protein